MANHESNWILNMIDGITKPAKDVVKSVKAITDNIDNITGAVKFNEKETKEALDNSKKHYKELQVSVREAKYDLANLKDEMDSSKGTARQAEATREYEKQSEKVKRLREDLRGARLDLEDLTDEAKKFTKEGNKWGEVFTGVNQGIELAQKAVDGMSFTTEINALRTDIQRMTETSGDELDKLTERAYKLGEVFTEDGLEIARAANAMTKQLGGSYQENFDLIEQGFEKGANLNGDFIDQLKEYGPQLKELGLNGSQSIALMAKAGKEGIFSDKAIDSIKEANLSLKEMGQTQIDALAGIGLKPEDLAGKTGFEAVQLITKQMEGAGTQARQLVMADIFKGAGEDAGFKFVEGLANVDLDINNIPSFKQAGSGIKMWLAELQTSFSETFGGIGGAMVQLAPVVTGIASMIPIIQSLSAVTWIQNAAASVATAAQKAWNFAMKDNPIGVIIMAIAALVAAIVWVATSFTGWGEMWEHVTNSAKLIFLAFVEGVKLYFSTLVNGIMMGINLIKIGWYEFKNAMGIGDKAENDAILAKIHADTEARKDAIVEGAKKVKDLALEANKEMELARGSLRRKEKKEDEKASSSVNDYSFAPTDGNKDAPTLDGKTTAKGTGAGSGGGNSSKMLNMTINVNQVFNIKDGSDWVARKQEILDEMVTGITDSLKDSLIAAG